MLNMFKSTFKNKYFCLICKKCFKHSTTPTICPTCHNDTLVYISYKSRAPKVNASKKKWEEFYNEIKIPISRYYDRKCISKEATNGNEFW
jgi:hypothetical protein